MVRKALIPIAGAGARMGPLAAAVPKALWPLIDGRSEPRPVLHLIIDEALSAGVEHIALIVSAAHIETVRRYFCAIQNRGTTDIARRIEYIVQGEPRGLGAAVECTAAFVQDEPFMLLLGDHVYTADNGQPSCATQVASAFHSQSGVAMVGVQVVNSKELHSVGVATGRFLGNGIYRCTDIVEKPDIATAKKRLTAVGLNEDQFLAHCGVYIFTTEILDCLRRVIASKTAGNVEIGLTESQKMLLEQCPDDYYLVQIDGNAYDTGYPSGYMSAQHVFWSR